MISKVKTRSPPGEVAGPREAEEGDGGEVVDKHLPEVFSLHVEKLHDGQRPVESQLKELQVMVSVNLKYHVVPPDDWLVVLHGGGFAACGGHGGGGV